MMRFVHLSLPCLLILIAGSLSAQPHAVYQKYQEALRLNNEEGDFAQAMTAIQEADSLLALETGAPDSLHAMVHYMYGILYYNFGDFGSSIARLRLADSLYQGMDWPGGRADCYLFLGNNHWYLEGAGAAIPFFDSAIALAEADRMETRRSRGRYYADKGYALGELGEFQRGIDLIDHALALDSAHFGLNSRQYGVGLMTKATVYNFWGEYVRAIQVYQQALSLARQQNGNRDTPNEAPVYANLASTYFNMNDLEEASRYFQKAYALYSEILPPNHPNFALIFAKFALIALNRGQPGPALEWAEKALALQEYLDPIAQISLMQCKAMVLNDMGKHTTADSLYRELEPLVVQHLGPEHFNSATLYENIADNRRVTGDTDGALAYQDKTAAVYRVNYPPDHPFHGRVLANKALACIGGKRYRDAIAFCNEGLTLFELDTTFQAGLVYRDIFLGLHEYRAEALWMLSEGQNTALLDSALADYLVYEQCLDSLYATERNPSDQLSSRAYQSGFFRNALQVFYQKHLIDGSAFADLWRLAEKSKSSLLLKGFRRSATPVVASALDTLRRITTDQQFYQKLIYDASLGGQTLQEDLTRWQAAVFDLERERRNWWNEFRSTRQNLPYYLESGRHIAKPGEIRELMLDEETALLEFVDAPPFLYIFALTTDTMLVVRKTPEHPLDSLVLSLRQAITGGSISQAHQNRLAGPYVDRAASLYDILIRPVEPHLKPRVIIVPDGALNYLPFDALLRSKPAVPDRFHSHDYFGTKHRLSVNYSATLLSEMQRKTHTNPPEPVALAMAPFFEESATSAALRGQSLRPLPASGREVERVCALFGGGALLGKAASKDAFEQKAEKCRIVHVSTHGWADSTSGDFAWIAFPPLTDGGEYEKFFINDLYNKRLNADMVVTSACETGIGEFKRGEGVLSLARAFTYAGAKSLVTTLWAVSDQETAELMIRFYEHLHTGMPKDDALWQAKTDFIQAHKTDGRTHPFFWSAFWLIGSREKL